MKRSVLPILFILLFFFSEKSQSQNAIRFPDDTVTFIHWMDFYMDTAASLGNLPVPISDSFTIETKFRHLRNPGQNQSFGLGNPWIKGKDFLRIQAIFDDALSGYINGFLFGTYADSLGVFSRYTQCFTNCEGLGGSINIQDTGWHHIALVNRGDSLFKYVDGVLFFKKAIVIGLHEENNVGFSIYGRNTEIDQVRIWNVPRTTTEINTFKDSCISYHPRLVKHLPFESFIGTDSVEDMADFSQNGYFSNYWGAGPLPQWAKGVDCLGCDYGLNTSHIIEGTTICQDSSISIYGTQFSAVQSSFSHTTYLAGLACDSIITTDVKVISNWTNIFQTLCLGDDLALPNGDTVYNVQGYYTDSIHWIDRGCPHTIALQLDVDSPVNDSVSVNSYTLTSHAGTQNSFQWLDCNNGMMIIPGAVNRSYTPGPAGSYAVLITTPRGCADTSECVSVPHVGLEGSIFSEIRIFPNPVDDYLYLSSENDLDLDLSIRDLRGKNVIKGTWFSEGRIALNLKSLASGVYFLELRSRDQKQILKILKE